jgi:hypothetical protein
VALAKLDIQKTVHDDDGGGDDDDDDDDDDGGDADADADADDPAMPARRTNACAPESVGP